MLRKIGSMLLVSMTFCANVQAMDAPIVFTRQTKNVDDIYLISPGGGLRQITDDRRKDSSPRISPDGKHMVFTSERVGWWKIWLMDLQRNSFQQLTDSASAEYAPCWSPDGSRIAFVSSRDGNSEIYVMERDGAEVRNVTRRAGDDTMPHWHRDGKIYFSAKVDGIYQAAVIDAEGSNRKVLTTGDVNIFMPQPSPSGDRLLYYSDQGGNLDIYTAAMDGSDSRRLTEHPLLDIRPRWSPDGAAIVFERGDKKRSQHIYWMRADGSDVRQLTDSGYNYAPAFVENCQLLCGDG